MASIEGKLSRVGLTDIIQMECLSGRQGTIVVSALSGSGLIDYNPGRITHVEFAGAKDKEAMIRMLVLDDGWFRVETRRSDALITIEQNWQNFLMDCVVEADEREDAREAGAAEAESNARKPVQGLLDQLPEAMAISVERENVPCHEWYDEREEVIRETWDHIEALTAELGPLLGQERVTLGGREWKDLVTVFSAAPTRTVKAAYRDGASLVDAALGLEDALNRTL